MGTKEELLEDMFYKDINGEVGDKYITDSKQIQKIYGILNRLLEMNLTNQDDKNTIINLIYKASKAEQIKAFKMGIMRGRQLSMAIEGASQ